MESMDRITAYVDDSTAVYYTLFIMNRFIIWSKSQIRGSESDCESVSVWYWRLEPRGSFSDDSEWQSVSHWAEPECQWVWDWLLYSLSLRQVSDSDTIRDCVCTTSQAAFYTLVFTQCK